MVKEYSIKKGIEKSEISYFDPKSQNYLVRSGALDGKHYGIYEDGKIIGHIVNDKYAGIEISFYYKSQDMSFLADLILSFSHKNFIKGERGLKAIFTEKHEMEYSKYFEEVGFKLEVKSIKDFQTQENLLYGKCYRISPREFYKKHPEMLQELQLKNPELAKEINIDSRLSNTSFKNPDSIKK